MLLLDTNYLLFRIGKLHHSPTTIPTTSPTPPLTNTICDGGSITHVCELGIRDVVGVGDRDPHRNLTVSKPKIWKGKFAVIMKKIEMRNLCLGAR